MNIETVLDHQSIVENRQPEIFFAVRFHAAAMEPPLTASAAYCLLIDQSASIDDHPFKLAQRFACEFIRHLPAKSLLSIVTFHERAEAILDLGEIADKPAICAMINELAPVDYGTNLSAGVLLAREQLGHAPASVAKKRIILLADGEHTTGIRDETLLVQIASACEITSIHLGSANAALLQSFSTKFYPNLSGEQLPVIIENELSALLPVAAQNVRLRIKALEFCENIFPLGFAASERSDGWVTFWTGDILIGEERTLCFNLTIPLFPRIDDQPCASLAGEALLELEAGYEEVTATAVTPKVFATTVRIPALNNTTYPNSDDGSLTLREGL